jgi:hypothetical protein
MVSLHIFRLFKYVSDLPVLATFTASLGLLDLAALIIFGEEHKS